MTEVAFIQNLQSKSMAWFYMITTSVMKELKEMQIYVKGIKIEIFKDCV